MKKATLILLAVLATLPVAPARADVEPVTLLISGGNEDSTISVSLSDDGRAYVILSAAPLEVGGDLCAHPEGVPSELFCKAPSIAGFEVNAGGGSDSITFSSNVPVPVTIRGGPGEDRLIGGGASDKLIGGPDQDFLAGRKGDDWMFGGPGRDKLLGGAGNDYLRGGPDRDKVVGGPGQNDVLQ